MPTLPAVSTKTPSFPPSLDSQKPDKARQGDLIAALEQVVDRLMKRFKAAQERLVAAKAREDDKAAREAQDEINALVLLKADMGAFAAHSTMSKQALDSAHVRNGLKDVLLGPAQLWEALRARSLKA
jgi:hypothetical protein